MQVVKFKYYDEFHCTGSECRDSCCKDWRIDLSKREYLNYKKLDCSPKLRKTIDSAFVRMKGAEAEETGSYAKMKLKEDGNCPFHDFDGLCMLQKELGEKVLSYTCTKFPRLQARLGDDALLCACNLTCPHVIEMLMDYPEGLEIIEEEYDGKDSYLNRGICSSTCTPKSWEGYSYFWTLKNAEIDILQNRNFTIQERLLILGFFCKKADEYLKNNEGQKLDSLYQMMRDNELCGKICQSLKAPQTDDSAAAKSVYILMKMHNLIINSTISEQIKKLFNQVIDNLNAQLTMSFSEDGEGKTIFSYDNDRYYNNVDIFRKIEADCPYILENILVNKAFMMAPAQGIFNNYFTLVVFYNTLKVCVPVFLKEDYTDSDLALAFTYAAKMILNTHLADMGTVNSFKETGSFDLPHAAFLIS